MLTAVAHHELVAAKDVCKDDSPFLCLECAAPLQFKKGTIKAHHFAHMIDAECRCGYGEGERQRQMKEEICATRWFSLERSFLRDGSVSDGISL